MNSKLAKSCCVAFGSIKQKLNLIEFNQPINLIKDQSLRSTQNFLLVQLEFNFLAKMLSHSILPILAIFTQVYGTKEINLLKEDICLSTGKKVIIIQEPTKIHLNGDFVTKDLNCQLDLKPIDSSVCLDFSINQLSLDGVVDHLLFHESETHFYNYYGSWLKTSIRKCLDSVLLDVKMTKVTESSKNSDRGFEIMIEPVNSKR